MNIKYVKKAVLAVAAFLVLSGCAEPDSVPLSQQDHCNGLTRQETNPLADFIRPYKKQMENKTGVYVLEQGTEAMMSRAWLTDHAETTIDIQYFIFSVDNVGLIATDYLVRAADRGVKVRVLVDDIMLEARGDELLMLAGHPNMEIKIYNPNVNIGKNLIDKVTTLAFDFHGLNQRMHNKVFIVDGQLAITGGRNVADEYFGFDHEYNFRDRDVFLAGKVVGDMETSFEEYWQHSLSVSIENLYDSNPWEGDTDFARLNSYACDPEHFHPEIRAEIAQVPDTFKRLTDEGKFLWLDKVEYVADKPGKNDRTEFLGGGSITQQKLVELAESARKSLTIQTPYLVTTKSDRAFLKSLVDRGVEIKILTNSLASNDNLEAFSGYQRNRKALLNTGVEVYEFRPDAKIRHRVMTEHMFKKLPTVPVFGLHAKTMTIDGEVTVIGTYNFVPFTDIHEESLEASKMVNLAAQFGEGWLIPAEYAFFAKTNVNHVVSLQPFGCIANHVVSKGIENKVMKLFPNMNLLFIDLDGGVSQANIFNRLHFLVKNAKDSAEILDRNACKL